MQQKTLLLASFISENEIPRFLENIQKKFNVRKESVFFFKTENAEIFLTTFQTKIFNKTLQEMMEK